MKKNRVFPGISEAWEEWLFMPTEEKYKERKECYEKEYPNGSIEHYHKIELQFQLDAERELIDKGTKRENHENEELHQRQLLIKYIKDEILKKSIEEKILKDACLSYNIDEIQKSKFYSSAKREIENKEHSLFDGIKIFTPELSALFSTEEIIVKNKVTGENKTINGFDLFKLYKTSFNEGQKYFDENYNVPPKIIYGENADAYIQDLHDNYFHVRHSGANEGWVFVKKFYPIFLSNEGISKHGYYAGIVCQVDEQVKKYSAIFKTFEKCELCIKDEGKGLNYFEELDGLKKSKLEENILALIEENDVKGWEYAFKSKSDLDVFVKLLVAFAETKQYTLPKKPIILKPRTKTKVAALLKTIYMELNTKDKPLKSNDEFFKIVRTLSPFNETI